MISGYLREDTITTVLRGLAQKRRSGVLQISAHGETFEIFFQSGKIIRAQIAEAPAGGPLERLCLCQLVPASAVVELGDVSLEDAYARLVGEKKVSGENFRRAVVAEEMDLLFSIVSLKEGSYEFLTRVPTVHPELALSVSAGQLLIDAIEYHAEKESFAAITGDQPASQLCITATDAHEGVLTQAEEMVLRCIDSVSQLSELNVKVLLSGREITQAIVALTQKGVVTIHPAEFREQKRELPRALADARSSGIHWPKNLRPNGWSFDRDQLYENFRALFRPRAGIEMHDSFHQAPSRSLVITFMFLLGVTIWSGIVLRDLEDALSRFTSAAPSPVIE